MTQIPMDSPLFKMAGLPQSIRKREGKLVAFDAAKIVNAMQRARAATGEFERAALEPVAERVLADIATLPAGSVPDIERIQDSVELALLGAGYYRTARAYIVYREQHRRLREDSRTAVDVESSINEYLERRDWRVNANANQGYSLGGLILNVSGKVIANYWLNHVYPPEVGRAHRDGDIHIHDLDMLAGYCAGWSLRTLLHEGLNGVPGKVEAAPPKHMSSAVGQIVNFLGTLQNEWAGAQAFCSFDTYMAPYIRKDGLSYAAVQAVHPGTDLQPQRAVALGHADAVHQPHLRLGVPGRPARAGAGDRRRGDAVRLRRTAARNGHDQPRLHRGHDGRRRQGPGVHLPDPDLQHDRGFRLGAARTPTLLFEMTAKYGLPYFQNFINSELKPNMIRSMCCRLQLDLRELLKRGNGLFGSAEQTGSLGVVTLNCARLGTCTGATRRRCCARVDDAAGPGARTAWRSSAR